jgi:hypothetical protein
MALRFAMSATAPAGNVSIKKGNAAEVESNDNKSGEAVRVFITHVAAISCAATQQPDKTLANQRMRNVGFRRAVQIDVVPIGEF